MVRKTNISGLRFGKLVAIRFSHRYKGRAMWLCQCDCGNTTIKKLSDLNIGNRKSCGCVVKKHGHAGSRKTLRSSEYMSYEGMKKRCLRTKEEKYKEYGAKGIKIFEGWLGDNGFSTFLKDMGLKPTPQHTIDRFPNKKGNYEPSNCRWATKKEQSSNLKNNVWVELFGEKMILAEFLRRINSTQHTQIHKQLKKYTPEEIYNRKQIKNA